jgi:hypothetical protein
MAYHVLKTLRYSIGLVDIQPTSSHIWAFPEMGIALNHPFIDGIFDYKPSSYWIPCLENPHTSSHRACSGPRLLDVLPQETYQQRLGGLQSQLRALEEKAREVRLVSPRGKKWLENVQKMLQDGVLQLCLFVDDIL